jgi:hypothetical protein
MTNKEGRRKKYEERVKERRRNLKRLQKQKGGKDEEEISD